MGIISLPHQIEKQEPLRCEIDKKKIYAFENATILNDLISKSAMRYIRKNPERNWNVIYNHINKEEMWKKYVCNTEYKCPEIILNIQAIINETLFEKRSSLKLFFT
ncbi:MAG: hypothetical protein FK733_18895 [Asgard group archaeon]|nr:hypothetical protein [Asgard group archaeon]